jgi:hypothetical protein
MALEETLFESSNWLCGMSGASNAPQPVTVACRHAILRLSLLVCIQVHPQPLLSINTDDDEPERA